MMSLIVYNGYIQFCGGQSGYQAVENFQGRVESLCQQLAFELTLARWALPWLWAAHLTQVEVGARGPSG